MRIRGHDVVALAKKSWAEIGKDRISVYAAQMAYSFFFALFPLLLFLAALLSLVADKKTVMAQFSGRIASALPGDVATLLSRTVEARRRCEFTLCRHPPRGRRSRGLRLAERSIGKEQLLDGGGGQRPREEETLGMTAPKAL